MIKVGPALMEHAEQLERERGIPRDVVISSLKEAMLAAYKRYAKLESLTGYECRLNEKSGEIGIYELKRVVKELSDPEAVEFDEEGEEIPREPEIELKEARKIKPDVELNDILEIEVTPDEFGRIAAQSAKQVITQRIREAEKKLVQKEFEEKRGSVTTAIVQRIEGRNVIVNIGKSEAILPPKEQLPSEYYRVGNKLRVYVLDLKDSGRVPQIIVSQAHAAMVKEVFELEVPEIEDGLVEIKSIAREAGYRTKVAVTSHDPDVDAQGACIGTRGSRIQAIVNELKNEKIDIIRWSPDPVEFIVNALAPAKIIRVLIMHDPRQSRALVIVPDDQLSLAIGREGQNVRLAAKLTGFKLDIKSIGQVEQEGGMGYFEQMAAPPADYIPEGQEFTEGEDQPVPVAAGEIHSEEEVHTEADAGSLETLEQDTEPSVETEEVEG
ncbi:transcription termination factor NusA [Vampirovibrio chlorellavorus]|uniref:transcription termination factor NusA n=1 Tax=Vampirovibrio chlorellavorus TaxID=758823 RepID=UPI0026F0607E|nr:transcription termination factor NusA [Vampirovibrio chlorellavorus]